MSPRRIVGLIVSLAALVGLLVACAKARTGRIWYCANTGEMMTSSEWRLPLTRYVYRRVNGPATPTAISRVVRQHHLELSSGHRWVTAYRSDGGGAVPEQGTELNWAIENVRVAAFLDAVARFQNTDAAKRWTTLFLDVDHGLSARAVACVPADTPFRDKPDFDAWLLQHGDDLRARFQAMQRGQP